MVSATTFSAAVVSDVDLLPFFMCQQDVISFQGTDRIMQDVRRLNADLIDACNGSFT
jgi:hypothetical protein